MAAIRKLTKALFQVCANKNFWIRILGVLDGYEILLIRTREIYPFDHKDPRLLVVGGFHGEEVAGPWAILKWLETCDESIIKSVDISFVPVVNPWGFARGKRYGPSNMPTNNGFCHPEKNDYPTPSPEGEILMKNIEILRPLAQDGFLSLHEDKSEKRFYMYTFEHGTKPGKFTKSLKKELIKYFPKAYDGVAYTDSKAKECGPRCNNGLVYKFCDGSFEDWMFHQGVPQVAVTETPGKYRLPRRITATVKMIDKFIELSRKEEK